jgi:sulfatase maturation enzyme AslB (radical SAM superfamily)
MQCIYCQQGTGAKAHVPFQFPTADEVAGYFPRHGDCEVRFFGGEPLLYFDYAMEVARSLRKRNAEIRLSVITNGTVLTAERVEVLNAMNFKVIVSHDGPMHCQTRGGVDFLVTKPEVYLGIKKLIFSATASKINFDFYKIWAYFEDFKQRHGLKDVDVKINIVRDVNGNTPEELLICEYKPFENMLDKVFFNLEDKLEVGDFIRSYEWKQFGEWFSRIICILTNPATPKRWCQESGKANNVDIYGRRYFCRNAMIQYDEDRNPYSKTANCKKCEIFMLCGGGCGVVSERCKKYDCYVMKQVFRRAFPLLLKHWEAIQNEFCIRD